MDKKKQIHKELDELYENGAELAQSYMDKNEDINFPFEYQKWYSKAMRSIEVIAPDRYSEFKSYYEIDPKRKNLGYGTYVIQDYLKGVVPSRSRIPGFDSHQQVSNCFINQLNILHSITERIDSVLSQIDTELLSEIQDTELQTANNLLKVNLRAAGSLTGVIIEHHLQKVSASHNIKTRKKNPTISDLNEPLKKEGIIDTPTWRKITYLADIRNICSHKKSEDPTKEQVVELIEGANWLIKNVF